MLVRPAYTTWKPGRGLFGRAAGSASDNGSEISTGELICRVEVPAEYRNVTRQRIARAASTEQRVIPAKTQTITKQVIDQEGRWEDQIIPAEYRTIEVQKLVTPEQQDTVIIPATYKTLERRVVQSQGGLEWREVLCETNTTPAKISEVQRALSAAGYATDSDGVFGASTLRAMEAFQRARGLAVGNLTIETVRALGVTP